MLERCTRCMKLAAIVSRKAGIRHCQPCVDAIGRSTHTPSALAKPPHGGVANPPTATPPKPPQEPAMPNAQRRNANRERVTAVIQEMVDSGRIIPRAQICRAAAVSGSYFSSNPDMHKVYEAALALLLQGRSAQLQSEQAEQPDQPVVTAPVEAIDPLQVITDLENRNRELRQQLAQLQEQKSAPRLVEVAMPLSWLKGQAQAWRDTVADCQKELEQIQTDIVSAQVNLAACERLISLHEVEAPIDVAALNGALAEPLCKGIAHTHNGAA